MSKAKANFKEWLSTCVLELIGMVPSFSRRRITVCKPSRPMLIHWQRLLGRSHVEVSQRMPVGPDHAT